MSLIQFGTEDFMTKVNIMNKENKARNIRWSLQFRVAQATS